MDNEKNIWESFWEENDIRNIEKIKKDKAIAILDNFGDDLYRHWLSYHQQAQEFMKFIETASIEDVKKYIEAKGIGWVSFAPFIKEVAKVKPEIIDAIAQDYRKKTWEKFSESALAGDAINEILGIHTLLMDKDDPEMETLEVIRSTIELCPLSTIEKRNFWYFRDEKTHTLRKSDHPKVLKYNGIIADLNENKDSLSLEEIEQRIDEITKI